MNITEKQMLERLRDWLNWYYEGDVDTQDNEDIRIYNAIRSLIESSSPSGSIGKAEGEKGGLIIDVQGDKEIRYIDGTPIPATSPAPTDLTPTNAEMQEHYNRGEMNDPAPLPKEADVQKSIHLSKSVEEAMAVLDAGCRDNFQDLTSNQAAALAVLKSALSKGVEAERRWAELVEDISRRTDQARTMEVKP